MNQRYLSAWSAVHVVLLMLVAYALGAALNPFAAYCGTLLIYWASCWGTIIFFRQHGSLVLPAKESQRAFFNWIPVVPAFAVASVVWSKGIPLPPIQLAALLIVGALINGITEESYWRKLYRDCYYPDSIQGLGIPWMLFSLWHVALLGIPNVSYEGGAFALVGGAAMLGAVWGLAYWMNHNFWMISSAHVVVNIFAFTMLAHDNAWLSG